MSNAYRNRLAAGVGAFVLAFALVGAEAAVAAPQEPSASQEAQQESSATTGDATAATGEALSVKLRRAESLKWRVTAEGEVLVTWKHDGDDLERQRLQVGLAPFTNRGDRSLAIDSSGERQRLITAAELKRAGAPLGSGVPLHVKVESIGPGSGEQKRVSRPITVMAGQPNAKPVKGAANLKVASYNVAFTPDLSAKALSRGQTRTAKQIAASGASVIALQESVQITQRGDTQFSKFLKKIQAAQMKKNKRVKWKSVRSTRYVKPGVLMGGEGTRLIYDSAKVKLLSKCGDKTGGKPYSSKCTIKLPRVGGPSFQRYAQYAQFQDRQTKKKFWVASVHFEPRSGAKYSRNVKAQMKKVVSKMKSLSRSKQPVLIMGDYNLAITRPADAKTLKWLHSQGYTDAATAKVSKNLAYRTATGWKRLPPLGSGFAGRIDNIFARGEGVHFSRYETVVRAHNVSDHYLVRATVRF